MLFPSRILRRQLRLLPPDLREERDGKFLLVWGNIPFWTVVDRDLERFLSRLDAPVALRDKLGEAGLTPAALTAIMSPLFAAGVLKELQPAHAAAPTENRIQNVAVNLTARCNLRCGICYARERLAPCAGQEITAAEICRFLDGLKPLLAKKASLVLLGGEPLLEEDKLMAVADHARRRGLVTIVSTNGTLVTPQTAARAFRARLQVQVSLDGPDATCHDAIRGEGAFAKTLAATRLLVRGGVYTVISMVSHEGNLDRLEEFLDLAVELGVREARFIPLKRIGGARESTFRPVPMSRLMCQAYFLLRRRPDLAARLGRDAFSVLANTCRYSTRRPSCGTGRQTVLLDADGSVYPCLNLSQPEWKLANVRDVGYDFQNTWRQSRKLEAVRWKTNVENSDRKCSRCPVRYWCLGGCRGETLALTGDVSLPSPDCSDLRRTMLDMMWILAECPTWSARPSKSAEGRDMKIIGQSILVSSTPYVHLGYLAANNDLHITVPTGGLFSGSVRGGRAGCDDGHRTGSREQKSAGEHTISTS